MFYLHIRSFNLERDFTSNCYSAKEELIIERSAASDFSGFGYGVG